VKKEGGERERKGRWKVEEAGGGGGSASILLPLFPPLLRNPEVIHLTFNIKIEKTENIINGSYNIREAM